MLLKIYKIKCKKLRRTQIIFVTFYIDHPLLVLLSFPQFFCEIFKNIFIAHKL